MNAPKMIQVSRAPSRCVLTIQSDASGKTSITLESDPAFPSGTPEGCTMAQLLVLAAWQAARNVGRDTGGEEEVIRYFRDLPREGGPK